jgi:lysophospholipase L1-like esterase
VEGEGTSLIDFVLVFFFVGNDFTDNTRSMTYYSVDENGRLLRDGTTNSLLGRRLVYKSHALSFLYMRIKPLINRLKYRTAGAAGAHIYSDSFYTAEVLEANTKALARFRDYVHGRGLRFAVVVIPEKDQLYKEFGSEDDRLRPNRMLARILDELAIPYLDLLPDFERRRDESLYNMIPGGHFSLNGHRVVAQLLIDFLDQIP